MRPDFKKMNNMIPAIVQDYKTQDVLMMAYVNEEAYDKMLETQQTYFYSRSRNELWHKGETSGHYQNIKGMYLDCDQDTLLILVEQIGVACHTGTYSCFYNDIVPIEKNVNIFHELYDLIENRKVNPVEKSYTNYLLNEGVDKICKKVGEEASETIIAAKNNDKEELIGELGDLFYHAFVLMSQQGIHVHDVEDKLKERHKISGNKKDFHTRGEY